MLIKKEFKNVPLDDLESWTDYQRPLDMEFIESVCKPGVFDKNEVDTPKVSVRNDGTKKMGDGQHTVAIVRKMGWKSIRCELRYGLTIEEENDWFSMINTKSRPQNYKRILTSQINGTYEKNKTEQDFNNCIKSIGFKLNIYGEKPGNDYRINCCSSLLSVFKEYENNNKRENFIECLDIIKACFNGNPVSLQWNFIRGMFDFYETYEGKFDIKRFVKIFSSYNSNSIRKEAENDIYTEKASMKYARLFVSKYNHKLPKGKRLKMSMLED